MAAAAKQKQPIDLPGTTVIPGGDRGTTGIKIDKGRPKLDPSPHMQPERAHGKNGQPGEYAKMRVGDSIIGGLSFWLRASLYQSDWAICERNDETDSERLARELAVSYFGLDGSIGMLYGGYSRLVLSLTEAILTGVSVNRLRWEVRRWRDRLVRVPVDVSWTHPGSFDHWIYDKNGHIAGLVQKDPNSKKDIVIRSNRLFHARFLALDNDPWGHGLLRACYAVYLQKSERRRLYMLALERLINGVFEIREATESEKPAGGETGFTGDIRELMADLGVEVSKVLTGERAGWGTPGPLTVKIHYPMQDIPPPTPDIEAANREMKEAFLTAIAFVGAQNGQERPVLSGLRTLAEWIAREIARGLLWPMMRANFDVDYSTRIPLLTPLRVEMRDPESMTRVLSELGNKRWLTPGAADEQALRREWGLTCGSLSFIEAERHKAVNVGAMTNTIGSDATDVKAPSQDHTDGRALEPSETEDGETDAVATPDEKAQDEALNGAQVDALLKIIERINLGPENGGMTPAQGRAAFRIAFPKVPENLIEELLADAGDVVVPSETEVPNAPE